MGKELIRLRENEVALIAMAAFAGFVIGLFVAGIDEGVVWLHHVIFGVQSGAHLSGETEIPGPTPCMAAGCRFGTASISPF